MFKELAICIIIIILILGGNAFMQGYTTETVEELSQDLAQLKAFVIQQGVENQDNQEQAEQIYKKWKEKYTKLAYFVEHNELEKIELELIEVKSYIETQQYEDLISRLDNSVFLLKHIEDKYDFNLKNIF